jgi:anthranilate phosphoribosyltransferase
MKSRFIPLYGDIQAEQKPAVYSRVLNFTLSFIRLRHTMSLPDATLAQREAIQKVATGPARDALTCSAAICLHQLGRTDSQAGAADTVRQILDNGKALALFQVQ